MCKADEALLEFEDTRIQRDFYNSLTRLDNCELANEMKSISAARKQLEDIAWIENYRSLDTLPERLQHVIEVRRAYPEASMNELVRAVRRALRGKYLQVGHEASSGQDPRDRRTVSQRR